MARRFRESSVLTGNTFANTVTSADLINPEPDRGHTTYVPMDICGCVVLSVQSSGRATRQWTV